MTSCDMRTVFFTQKAYKEAVSPRHSPDTTYRAILTEGSDTKASILRQALNLSSEVDLESLSWGVLESGLCAHFKSKEVDRACAGQSYAACRMLPEL